MTTTRKHPDEELRRRADEIAAAEGISYAEAMIVAGKRDPELLRRYMAQSMGDRDTTMIVPPAGKHLVDRDPSRELAERAAAIVASRGYEIPDAQDLALSEDPALAIRYHESISGRDPFREVADAATLAAGPDDFGAAAARMLAERPDLARRVNAYFED